MDKPGKHSLIKCHRNKLHTVQAYVTISHLFFTIWEETVAKNIVEYDSDTDVVTFEPPLHVEMSYPVDQIELQHFRLSPFEGKKVKCHRSKAVK